jgi:hypothetical protein
LKTVDMYDYLDMKINNKDELIIILT